MIFDSKWLNITEDPVGRVASDKNDFKWLKMHKTVKNVVYYLKCPTCVQTYTGQTNNLRLRMNGHRSGSRLGNNTNIFDRHIFQCRKKAQSESEPLFLIYAFLTVGNARMLLSYENHLHDLKYDTMN